MIKKFEEFINERMDYSYDDVKVNVHRNIPKIDRCGGSPHRYEPYMDEVEHEDTLFYTDDKLNFEIWKVEYKGKVTNVWRIQPHEKIKGQYKNFYFKVDSEMRESVPMGIGDVYIVENNNKKFSSAIRYYLFNTETGEISKDNYCKKD